MSRGQSQSPTLPRRTILRRCTNKDTGSTSVALNGDKSEIDVIIIDAQESSHQSSCFKERTGKLPLDDLIEIVDEDADSGNVPSIVPSTAADGTVFHAPSCFPAYEVLDNDDAFIIFSKKYHPSEQECVRVSSDVHCRNHFILDDDSDSSSSGSVYSEILTCESDNSDCEIIEDPYGSMRQQWEKAATFRKQQESYQNELEDQCCTSGTSMNHSFPSVTTQNSYDEEIDMDDISLCFNRQFNPEPSEPTIEKKLYSCNHPTDTFFHPFLSRANASSENIDITTKIHNDATAFDTENGFPLTDEFPSKCQKYNGPGFNVNDSSLYHDIPVMDKGHECIHAEPSLCTAEKQIYGCFQERDVLCPEFPADAVLHAKGEHVVGETSCNQSAEHLFYGNNDSYFEGLSIINKQPAGDGAIDSLKNEKVPQPLVDLIGAREILKETEEYRHAMDQEWAARKRELEIQAEEAHRLRKRKKVESLRLLEMEKRQKLRIEEIREAQKKDMENIDLKDRIRIQVRKELDILERKCNNLVSLLRALGIDVKGGPFPLPHEVNAAYKQALLRFHPDRTCSAGIHWQVEAEEKFKLISRVKGKAPAFIF